MVIRLMIIHSTVPSMGHSLSSDYSTTKFLTLVQLTLKWVGKDVCSVPDTVLSISHVLTHYNSHNNPMKYLCKLY